jgi:putative flippase GtrA
MKGLTSDGTRFVVFGLLNMVLSLALYQVLLFIMPASAAYAITWVIGIAFVAILYPAIVFSGVRQSWNNSAITATIYVCSFVLGSTVIVLADRSHPGNRLSIFAALTLTTIFNFLAMRLLLRRENKGNSAI